MKILLISATTVEIAPTIQYLDSQWEKRSFLEYSKNKCHVYPLVSGIGSMMIAFAIARFKQIKEIDFAIHVGLSGSFRDNLNPTELVEVISEQWADLGAEEADGKFLDGFELELMEKDRFPYKEGKLLKTRKTISTGLQKVAGVTVNKTSGNQLNIDQIKKKFNVDVESMEGAGFFYACNVMDLPFISIRAISNSVEPRDKSKWKLNESIDKLNTALIKLLETPELSD